MLLKRPLTTFSGVIAATALAFARRAISKPDSRRFISRPQHYPCWGFLLSGVFLFFLFAGRACFSQPGTGELGITRAHTDCP